MVRIFDRVGLQKRFGKTKAMVFNPGFIWGKLGSAAYKRRAMGEGATLQERNKTREVLGLGPFTVPHMVGQTGEFDKAGIPRGVHPSGTDMDNNGVNS